MSVDLPLWGVSDTELIVTTVNLRITTALIVKIVNLTLKMNNQVHEAYSVKQKYVEHKMCGFVFKLVC